MPANSIAEFFGSAGNVLMVAVGFGFVIFVHELGHFLLAKRIGAKVETFSLGFGPRLFGFKRGGTDYRISLVPLGGYVKIQGQGVSAEKSESPDDFERKPVGKRMQVIVAGVAMNFLFTFPLCIAVLLLGREVPTTTVYDVRPGSPAFVAGVKPGDVIESVAQSDASNGDKITDEQWKKGEVANWVRLREVMVLGEQDESIFLKVKRADGGIRIMRIPPQRSADLMLRESDIGMQGGRAKVIVNKLPDDSIQLDQKAEGDKLQEGDVILSMRGVPLDNPDLLNALVFDEYVKKPGEAQPESKTVPMTIERTTPQGEKETLQKSIATRVKGYYDAGIVLYQKPVVGSVRAFSAAADKGIKAGDIITSVAFADGAPAPHPVEKWQDFEDALGAYLKLRAAAPDNAALKTISLGIKRPENAPPVDTLLKGWAEVERAAVDKFEEVTIGLEPEDAREMYMKLAEADAFDAASFAAEILGIASKPGLYVWEVSQDSPLIKDYKGVIPGDELIAKGDRVFSIGRLDMRSDIVNLTPREALVLLSSIFTEKPDDKNVMFVVAYQKPWQEKPANEKANEAFQSLGVRNAPVAYRAWLEIEPAAVQDKSPAYITHDKEELGPAIVHGAQMPFDILGLTYISIAKMISGEASANQLSGPVGILQMSYKFAETGVAQFLWFLAVISVSLAVLNILPVPVLDGGHMAFLVAEKLRGKPVSEKIRGRLEVVGLVLLLGLVVFATKNDIFRLFGL